MKERLSGNPAERGAADETRREALKRFGRYAAAAPTAMLLLDPRPGRAHHRAWHNPPGPLNPNNPNNGRGNGGGYEG